MTIKKRACEKCDSTNIVYSSFTLEDKLFIYYKCKFTYYKCEDCNMDFVTNAEKYQPSLASNQPRN